MTVDYQTLYNVIIGYDYNNDKKPFLLIQANIDGVNIFKNFTTMEEALLKSAEFIKDMAEKNVVFEEVETADKKDLN